MSDQKQNEFLLLFRGDEWYNGLSQDELRQVMDQTKAWFDRLGAQGKVKAGQPLLREGAVVSGKNDRAVSDGPFAESKEAIGGYLLIQADSLQEAITIAQNNPVLRYGTKIEVRPVAEKCPLDARVQELEREEQLVATTA